MPCLKDAPWGEGGPSANTGSLGFEGTFGEKGRAGSGLARGEGRVAGACLWPREQNLRSGPAARPLHWASRHTTRLPAPVLAPAGLLPSIRPLLDRPGKDVRWSRN